MRRIALWSFGGKAATACYHAWMDGEDASAPVKVEFRTEPVTAQLHPNVAAQVLQCPFQGTV